MTPDTRHTLTSALASLFFRAVLLNKTDLVEEADLVRVESRLKSMNSNAAIKRCTRADVAVDWVLDIGAFDLKRTLEMDPGTCYTRLSRIAVTRPLLHG